MTAKKSSPKKSHVKRPHILTQLKLTRLHQGLEQKEVAKLLGIHGGELSEIELGIRIPSPAVRSLLSAFFNVPEPELFPPNQRP